MAAVRQVITSWQGDTLGGMSEGYLFQRDSYRRQASARVVRWEPATNGRLRVELADTIFYPEGGGQPADRGRIGAAAVVEVRKLEGRIVHTVEGEAPAGEVELRLDWERRYDHMQQHTAQHLLTSLAAERLGWTTTGFGIGPGLSHIDLDIKRPPDGKLRELEALVAAEIRAARPVRVLWVDRQEMERLPVRSRRLPAELDGPIRLVEIEGVDLNTCGGTHVANTAELETFCIVGTEPMHGGTRLHWVAGGRVRHRMAGREGLLKELRRITGASDEDLAAAVGLKLGQLRQAQAEARRLREQEALRIAEEMSEARGTVVARGFEHGEVLAAVAPRLAGRPGEKVFLLVAGDGTFALALAEELPADAGELGPVVAAILHGKGGGRDRLYRGKATSPERLDEAVRALETALQG